MRSCSSDHPTGHDAQAFCPDLARPSGRRTIPASRVDRLGPEDLFAAGQTACHLGVVQLLDRATGWNADLSAAAQVEAADDEVEPEELLATGFAACLWGALMLVFSHGGTTIPQGSLVTAQVTQSRSGPHTLALGVALRVSLPGLGREAAEALVHRAHEVCPYTPMSRQCIDVRLAA
jgi:Ohr subfamily peroxiredoxin